MLMLEDKYAEIIKTIGLTEHGYYDPDAEESETLRQVEDRVYGLHKGYSVMSGITKFCVIAEDLNMVIKCPYAGHDYMVWDDDEDCYYSEEDYSPFGYANDIDEYEDSADCWDYCENELNKYEIAKEAGFDDFLLETSFYGEVNNVKYYLQEKARPYRGYESHKEYSKDTENSFNTLSKKYNMQFFRNSSWAKDAIEYFGGNRIEAFIEWDKKNEFSLLSDLHSGNIGYAKNGRPVILDWAGYREN